MTHPNAHVIYALVSTRNRAHYRYVGQSRSNLRKRMNRHLYQAKHGGTRDIYRWIRGELAADADIELVLLEECEPSDDVLNEREQYWIERLRSEGHSLTNMIRGGTFVPLSEEGRAKCRDAALEFMQTPAGRASAEQLSAWIKTPEGRKAASEGGKTGAGGRAAQEWRRNTPEGRAVQRKAAAAAGRAAAEWRRNTPEGQAEVDRQRERFRAVSSKGAKVGNHVRHHRNKGVVNPKCDLCNSESD